MAVSGERHCRLAAYVGGKQPPDRAVFAERVRDYALATLFNLNIAVGFHLLAAKNAKNAKRPLYFNQMLFIELAGT